MSTILRILQDPALMDEDEANAPASPLNKLRPSGGAQKGGKKEAAGPTATKGGARRESGAAAESKTASRAVSRRASLSGEDPADGSGAKKEQIQLLEFDEDHPLVARLPSKDKASGGGADGKPPSPNMTAAAHTPNKADRLKAAVSGAGGSASGSGQGAEVKYGAIFDSTRPAPALIAQLKQWMSPQIAQRSNVVALFTGHGREESNNIVTANSAEAAGKAADAAGSSKKGSGIGASAANPYGAREEFTALMTTIYDSLRGTVISATEAHQEMLSVMAEEDTSLRGKAARLMADRAAAAAAGGGGGIGGHSPGTFGDLPELANDATAGSSFLTGGGDSATTPTRGRVGSLAGSPSAAAQQQRRAQSAMTAASSPYGRSKYSLLMARLPRNSAELEVTQLVNVAKPLLPRLSDNGSSSRRQSMAGGSADGSAPSKVYLRYMRSRSPIGVSAGASTSTTKNNGTKAGLMKAIRTSPGFVTLPFPQPLTDAFKDPFGFALHVWVRSEGEMDTARCMTILHAADQHEPNFMVRLMANTNDVATFERGQMLLTCRDGQGKYVESVFTCDACDGEWHQISIFINAKSKSLAMAMDGKNCRSRLLNTDDIGAFDDARRRVIFLGASPTDDHKAGLNPFSGFVLDFQSAVRGNKLVQHYPLARNEAAYAKDESKKGLLLDETLLAQSEAVFTDVDCEEVMFCRTAPYFDGRGAHINVGSLGDWGFIRTGSTIEFKMRVSNSAEPMCVIGVTDIAGKHGGFGVELNAGINGTLQRHHMSVWATDYEGNTVRGACDLTSDVFDDRWHSISIRFSDLSAGKFKIRLDNRPIETQSAASADGPPTNFTVYSTHVTIGCLNNRGRHERFFKGSLKNFRLSHLRNEEDEPFATWPLDEGPHAKIAWDITSHGYSGKYEAIAGERPFEWLPVGDDDDSSENDLIDVSKLNVTRHNHNLVSIAIVAVCTLVNPRTGRTYEVLEDVLNGETVTELEPVALRDFNHRVKRSDERVFKTIPEDCFRPTDSAEYLALFRQGIARAQEYPRAHIIAVLRLGDAMFTAVDFASFTKSDKARLIVTPSHVNWADVTNTDGPANKVNIAINAQLANAERLFAQMGRCPQLYKRTRFLRDAEAATKGQDMLSSILIFSALASVEPCKLFLFQYLPPYASRDEALHTLLLNRGMRNADAAHAALVISRTWRGKLGRNIHQQKVKLRDEAAARKSRAELLRKQFPKETAEKRLKHVLLVKSTVFYHDKVMPQPIFDTAADEAVKVAELFVGMDFTVETLLDPSVESLWKALRHAKTEQAKQDSMLIVYFIGYGAHDAYTQPPTTLQQLSWAEEEEALARCELLEEHRGDWTYVWNLFWDELRAMHKKETAAYEEAVLKASKKKKKKRAASPARGGAKGGAGAAEDVIFQPPPMPRKESAEATKRGMLAWVNELSPPVTRRSAVFSTTTSDGTASAAEGSGLFDGLSASAAAPFGFTMSVANTTLAGTTTSSSHAAFSFNSGAGGTTARGRTVASASLRSGGGGNGIGGGGGLNRTLAGTGRGNMLTPDDSPLSPTSGRPLSPRSDASGSSGKEATCIRFDENHVSSLEAEAEPLLEPQTYILAADSATPFNSSNTILLSEVKNYIVGQKPRRGEHSIFIYDCATIPTQTMSRPPAGGFGGFAGASGEALHAVYHPSQRYAFGYYLKKCLIGAAVECVRIGRHPTEQCVTLETASRYMNLKLSKENAETTAPRPVRSLHTRWFGEFIGDCLLAPKLLTTKEDRRAKKAALAAKRVLTQLTIRWNGALISEFRAVLQAAIARLAAKGNPCDLRRLSLDDSLLLTFSDDPSDANGCDYNALTRHDVARRQLKEDLQKVFADAPKLSYSLLFSHPPQISVSLLTPTFTKNTLGGVGAEGGGGGGGGSNNMDAKTQAMEFVQHLEHRSQLIDDHLVANGLSKFEDGTRTIAGGRIARASVIIRVIVTVSDEDAQRMERLARRDQSGLCPEADLLAVHVLNEKECAAYENEERMFALDEVRKQNETKLRLTREAEARRKAEEARVKMLEKKDAMLDLLRQCKSAGRVEADDMAAFFTVPLVDALIQVVEALASMASKANGPTFVKYGLAEKIEKMLCEDLVASGPAAAAAVKPTPPTGVNIVADARLLLNLWRLIVLMAQSGAPIATPQTLQVLLVSTFGGYQQSLNAVLVKTAAQALQMSATGAAMATGGAGGGGGGPFSPSAAPPAHSLLLVDYEDNRTVKAVAAKRNSSIAAGLLGGGLGAGASPSRQRLSSAATAAAAAAAAAEAHSAAKIRPIFDHLMRQWPARVIPPELSAELEAAVVKLAPSVADLIRAAGIRPAPPKKPKAPAGSSGYTTARSGPTSPRGGDGDGQSGGVGAYNADSDDDGMGFDEQKFPVEPLFAEVLARCEGCAAEVGALYAQWRRETDAAAAAEAAGVDAAAADGSPAVVAASGSPAAAAGLPPLGRPASAQPSPGAAGSSSATTSLAAFAAGILFLSPPKESVAFAASPPTLTSYALTPSDMAAIADAAAAAAAAGADLPQPLLLAVIHATALFLCPTASSLTGGDSTDDAAARAADAFEFLSGRLLWAKEEMESVGPALLSAQNPNADTLRRRLAANWGSDDAMQRLLLTEEERAPPPPPPPPVVEEPPKRGGRRR